jgi:hypothetical protein
MFSSAAAFRPVLTTICVHWRKPGTGWLDGMVERNERGFILTGPDLLKGGKRPKNWTLDRDPSLLETNIPGVFAVGECDMVR